MKAIMLTKTRLKELLEKYGLQPLKSLGANYLIDANVKNKIIRASGVSAEDTVLEIGPGTGALTFDLAGSGAKVIAVDKDRGVCAILNDLKGGGMGNLKVVNDDILEFDIPSAAGRSKLKVIGSLPYYITTPIIERIVDNRRVISSALVVIQKEVAARLVARPGGGDYGSLSCYVQYYSRPEHLFTIARRSFYPVPEVDSALVRLEMLEKGSVDVRDEGLFFSIIRGAFNQRRKSIINSLSRRQVLDMTKSRLEAALKKAGVDPSARPDSLGLGEFAAIANNVRP